MLFIVTYFFSLFFSAANVPSQPVERATNTPIQQFETSVHNLYDEMHLEGYDLTYEAFRLGIIGYCNLQEAGQVGERPLLTIIDFSKPSTEKRLFIIDLEKQTVLFHTLVAHGRNTGNLMATNFSNTVQSLQSSLGFLKTGETYIGKHGYSLQLDGLEPAFNSKARERAVVIHPADYVSEAFAERHGRLGRSWGCPALPPKQSKKIIDTIKGGTLIFAYAPDEDYLAQSSLLDLYAAIDIFLEQFA